MLTAGVSLILRALRLARDMVTTRTSSFELISTSPEVAVRYVSGLGLPGSRRGVIRGRLSPAHHCSGGRPLLQSS